MNDKIAECEKNIEGIKKRFDPQVEKCHQITKELEVLNIFKNNLERECEDRKRMLKQAQEQAEKEALQKEIASKQQTLDGIMKRKFELHAEKKMEDIKAVEIKFELDNNYELISMLNAEKWKIYQIIPEKELDGYEIKEEKKGNKK